MISGLKSEDYEDRLKELGLTSLEERRHRADMALVHSVMHGHSDVNVDDWFQKADISARATRVTTGALNVRPRYGRLEVRKHSFTVRGTTNWNSVPRNLSRKQVQTVLKWHMLSTEPRTTMCETSSCFSRYETVQGEMSRMTEEGGSP